MKKSERITSYVAGLGADPALGLHPCYQGYFTCFNAGEYYEAHDVLEHLWLQQRTGQHPDFFKGLIQFAGAFVHLRHNFLHPEHPKHKPRLRPAVRLFQLAFANLEPFGPWHLYLDVPAVCALGREYVAKIEAEGFTVNPWRPGHGPRLALSLPPAETKSTE